MTASGAPGPLHVISGGQTGVDRGALDAAIATGLPHGGTCPRGRRAEDGRIPGRYRLTESPSADYAARTERNVLDADGTLVLCAGPLTGGTALTVALARKHGRPHRVVDLDRAGEPAARDTARWLEDARIRVLNVAGPRESSAPGIGRRARRFLLQVLDDPHRRRCTPRAAEPPPPQPPAG